MRFHDNDADFHDSDTLYGRSLISPSGLPLSGEGQTLIPCSWRPLPSVRRCKWTTVMKLEAAKEKEDLLPFPCLGPQAGPDSHLLPSYGAQGRHAPREILAENFQSSLDRKSSMTNKKQGWLRKVEDSADKYNSEAALLLSVGSVPCVFPAVNVCMFVRGETEAEELMGSL
ncbi:hypothetical protein E2C01_029714 [Portunus trituberculatus]|uniref:Uncharacterized protein n=1 Tax=Portunus trituberculatus TaxID=210409 RepID=A0A5B7EQ24_PORTR|nr:hypothetical protein [Portunus trituberculatus]